MRLRGKSVLALTFIIWMMLAASHESFAQGRAERPRTPEPASPAIDTPGAEGLVVKLWTDKGDQTPTYFVGERIYISFSVTKDSYLILYDIDSTGNVNILFPNPYHPDNLVRRGRVYTIPSGNYGHDLFIKGPTGEEILYIVASTYAYYHWQYGQYPPPIWSDEWGPPSTWGHSGGQDYSVASRRFQQRLQFSQTGNMAELTVKYIKHQTDEIVKAYPVMYARCKFYVTIPPY
ncbi:hypothetical protein U14_05440 [Candidatus Moduliflexus flocculans]|uniref:DUF4384 domain-containing protein n=1 Tax=Candidatus Moduliflexus flocculans TaxID=1499966 RepID=A0A081BRY0_9BACT|nr:hypothetical protein U14_05440 [Candidatus Moduliflexus flocculans]